MVLKRRYAGRSTPIRQSGRRMGKGGRIRFHFCAVTTSRYFEGNGNSASLSRNAGGAPESDHLRPRPCGRYRHPNRAESAFGLPNNT